MILVLGGFTAREGMVDEALVASQEHCARSRAEPGCLSHDVYRDVANPLALSFVERWLDRAALAAHFQLPASRDFVKVITALSAKPGGIQIFEGEPITRKAITGSAGR